ncbi:MAG: type II secretion system protein GspL [Gammaproteobacteria bacterium]|nr:type II secretion system protein GspL [Gammaproteobacteria bacterium]
MAEYLVIRLGTDPANLANWIAVDSDGTRRSPPVTGPLAEAARDVGDRDVIVLVPAASVLTTTIDIPIRGGSRLLAALPFALEENLAEDIDKLHFAAGNRRESGLLPVAVVSLQQMDDWLGVLEAAGIKAAKMIPENHGLAIIPGTMSLLAAEDQIMFNDGADTEFVLQGVSPRDALSVAGVIDAGEPAAQPDQPPPPGHLLVYCEPADEQRFAADWNWLRDALASVDMNLLPDGVLARLAVTVAAGRGINLLQGRFGARAELSTVFEPWRYAAVLLLALGLVGITGKAVDYYRLSRDEAALKQQFTEEYRQIRPDDAREIVDPIGTVSSIRRSLGGPAASQVFLPSLQQLSDAIRQNAAAEIEAITYRAGVIDVRLTAPDVATLDSIQKLVSGSGRFQASIQSTDQVGDKVSSRIQIREAGA